MEAFDAAAVTGIIRRRVAPGHEAEAESVMREIMKLAQAREGFLGSEIFPPIPGVQDGYVVLYRFSQGRYLRAWLECSRRKELLDKIEHHLVEPAVEFYFTHGRRPGGTASSVFAYRIRPEKSSEFQAWRRRIVEEVRKWDGYLGTESFDSLEGSEPEFIVVVRFNTRAHLDAWLRSEARNRLMSEVKAFVQHVSLRRIGSGFEGWFDHSPSATSPARWRQGLIVLSALFPVIMVMRHLLDPLFRAFPLPTAFLILLTINMAILTYGVMPWYSRAMDFWLRPRPDSTWRGQVAGWAVIFGILALTLVGFLGFSP